MGMSLGLSTALGSSVLGGGGASAWAPVAGVNAVVIIGASLQASMFGKSLVTPHAGATSALLALGYNLPVYGYATSSTHLSDAAGQYSDARAAFPNAIIVMHQGGNDVSDTRPYNTLTGPETTALQAAMAALVAVAANDTKFFPMSLSFRSYGDPATDTTVFADPSLGSKPYNESLFIPWFKANWPRSVAPSGRPKLDFYRRVLQNYETWLVSDGIHLNSTGQSAGRAWIMARVADLLGGVVIADITERVYVPPPQPVGVYVVNFGQTTVAGPDVNFIQTDLDGAFPSGTITKTIGSTGWSIKAAVTGSPAITGTTNPAVGASNTGRTGGGGTYDGTLLNGPVTAQFWFVTATPTLVFTFSGLLAGASYRIGVVGTRAVSGTRTSRLSDGVNSVSWNACQDPVQTYQITSTANGSGEIVVTLSQNGGDTLFAYVDALSIEAL